MINLGAYSQLVPSEVSMGIWETDTQALNGFSHVSVSIKQHRLVPLGNIFNPMYGYKHSSLWIGKIMDY